MQTIRAAIKSTEMVVREYVKKLESENAKLQRQIAKLECNDMSQKNKISALPCVMAWNVRFLALRWWGLLLLGWYWPTRRRRGLVLPLSFPHTS